MEQLNKNTEKIMKMILKLEPQEFIGVCKILGVKIYDEIVDMVDVDDFAAGSSRDAQDDSSEITEAESTGRHQRANINIKVRSAEDLIVDVVDKVEQLNRTQRRNLMRLLKPATKGR